VHLIPGTLHGAIERFANVVAVRSVARFRQRACGMAQRPRNCMMPWKLVGDEPSWNRTNSTSRSADTDGRVPSGPAAGLSPDHGDEPFCACAESGQAGFIVTLNPSDSHTHRARSHRPFAGRRVRHEALTKG
jgi:hypothetical protein